MWLSFIAILSFHCFIGEAWHTTPPSSLSSTTIQYNSTTTRPSRKPTVRIYPGFLAAKIIMLILIATCFCCAGNQWLRRRGYYMQDPGNSYQPFAPFAIIANCTSSDGYPNYIQLCLNYITRTFLGMKTFGGFRNYSSGPYDLIPSLSWTKFTSSHDIPYKMFFWFYVPQSSRKRSSHAAHYQL